MTEISAIVLIITGVLQIILFFKIWGMANDVKKLKERFKFSVDDDVRTAYLNGQIDIAQTVLIKKLEKLSEIKNNVDPNTDPSTYDLCIEYVKKLQEFGHQYGLVVPEDKGKE